MKELGFNAKVIPISDVHTIPTDSILIVFVHVFGRTDQGVIDKMTNLAKDLGNFEIMRLFCRG